MERRKRMDGFFDPGQAVCDDADNGIVVSVSAMSVKVYFRKHGIVDYLKPLSESDVAVAGIKTTRDLRPASSTQELATLLLRLFLSKKAFGIQDGKIAVLEDGKTLQLDAGSISEAIEAIRILL